MLIVAEVPTRVEARTEEALTEVEVPCSVGEDILTQAVTPVSRAPDILMADFTAGVATVAVGT